MGHFPGPGRRTCGCIEQVHSDPSADAACRAGDDKRIAPTIAAMHRATTSNVPALFTNQENNR
jgi:hypothetical protein